MENNLKKLREAAGLSTVELAAQVGATALDIHRIELNRLLAPVHVAKRVAAALKQPIEAVFPGTHEALSQFNKENQLPGFVAEDTIRRMREVGLEGEARQYTLLVLLRGHKKTMSFPLEPQDAARLFSVVQHEKPSGPSQFLCFNSANLCVAISLSRLVYIHILWEAPFVTIVPAEKDGDVEDPDEIVRVFVNEDSDPVILRAEPENGSDYDNERNYLNDIFFDLDSGFKEPHERVHIVDDAGESAFFRVGDIALITAPLWVLYRDELDLRDEGGNLPDE